MKRNNLWRVFSLLNTFIIICSEEIQKDETEKGLNCIREALFEKFIFSNEVENCCEKAVKENNEIETSFHEKVSEELHMVFGKNVEPCLKYNMNISEFWMSML
ncbi:uncharacterized protein LOC111635002 [Centruroides sculpturatus]|uniref:uncharacterized protein LOC111635002 n=1 Tax=Centruroides sculpturatus TaxID=218467 RepID=UPI000C6C9E67|nr:uncharacterized protein LOC111635002 [Centruroides sculpturatus]